MQQKEKQSLIVTILLISLFQMGMVALAPVVSSVATAFQGTSALLAQLSNTFLNLVLVLFALLSGKIARRFGRRLMCTWGMVFFSLAGICGTFMTKNILTVFLWSAFLGIGTGLFTPAISSMMIDFLSDKERSKIAGIQTAFVNLGGMLLSFLSGLLAATVWTNAYLVFLLSAPAIFMALKFIPKEDPARNVTQKKAKAPIPLAVWLAALQTTVFAILYFAFSTNISLLLVEKGITNPTMAGTATAVFMLGGCLFGFIFTKVIGHLQRYTAVLAFAVLTLSDLLIYFTDGMVPLMLAALIGGGSLSLIFPCFLVTIANKVNPEISVISSSLILSVGPNLGSFVSPLILTNLSNAIFGEFVAARFLLCAMIAAVLTVVLSLLYTKRQ